MKILSCKYIYRQGTSQMLAIEAMKRVQNHWKYVCVCVYYVHESLINYSNILKQYSVHLLFDRHIKKSEK